MNMGKDSSRDGKWKTVGVFFYGLKDEDGSAGYFATSQSKTDKPTVLMGADSSEHKLPVTLKAGVAYRIHYRLNPTNAVTYTLRFWSHALDPDYHSNMHMIYESPAAQADDVDYDDKERKDTFILYEGGKLYMSIEWTGAPGVTPGFITIEGKYYE